jgi:hypothetical protein
MTVKKEDLLKARFGVRDVDIPGLGSVKVRSLTRAETLEVAAMFKSDDASVGEPEALAISYGLVEPKLTKSEARQWQKTAESDEVVIVTDAIMNASGSGEDATKEAIKQFRE